VWPSRLPDLTGSTVALTMAIDHRAGAMCASGSAHGDQGYGDRGHDEKSSYGLKHIKLPSV